jgi:hypothetical protein
MTARLKKLLIACHPDRHGGDHSRMDEYFRAAKRPAHGTFRCVDCATAVSRQGTRCGVCFQAKRRIKKVLPVAALLLLFCTVASAQPKGAALMLPNKLVSAVRTNTQRTLVWDSSEPQFNVYIGAKRSSIVKVATVNTNGFPYTNGAVYAVSSVNFAGVESSFAYYPSNRVGALVWQTSTNLSTWTTGGTLEVFTNTPARPRMFLRVVDQTTGWLPPD